MMLIHLKSLYVLLVVGVVFGTTTFNIIPIVYGEVFKTVPDFMIVTTDCTFSMGCDLVTALTT